jgi:hypothetical protein
MIRFPPVAITASALMFGAVCFQSDTQAQDLSQYRDFRLRSTLASVEKTSGAAVGEVTKPHARDAGIQELRWRPSPRYDDSMRPTEPVREVIFTFYNDRLFQIVVDYDRERTQGLTDADLIESISVRYGMPVLTSTSLRTNVPSSLAPPDGDAVVARWSDADASLTLVRGTYPTSLRLLVVLKAIKASVQNAAADASRQDHDPAPPREITRINTMAEDGRVASEQARIVNKPLFKP